MPSQSYGSANAGAPGGSGFAHYKVAGLPAAGTAAELPLEVLFAGATNGVGQSSLIQNMRTNGAYFEEEHFPTV